MANFSAPRHPEYAMPKDTAEFHSFINDRITPTGCLARDYREALADALGIAAADANEYSLNDLYKRWVEAGTPYPP